MARELRAECGGAECAFVFLSADWADHLADLTEILQIEGRAKRVIGCCADGIMGGEHEFENVTGCTVLFLNSPRLQVRTWLINEAFRLPVDEPKEGAWMLLGHPMRLEVSNLLKDMNAVWPGMPVLGGMASGSAQTPEEALETLFTFDSEHGRHDAAGMLLHLGGVKIIPLVSQGCRPIGEPWTITRAQDDLVYAMGGKPAWQMLQEALETLPLKARLDAQGNIMAGLAANEYQEEFKSGDFVVRPIRGGDPVTGALRINARPRTGQTLQFQLRERTAAEEDLRQHCAAHLASHAKPWAGLLFGCVGRGVQLFGLPGHDAGMLQQELGPFPLAGFFTGGEIGPVGGVNFLHTFSACAALFCDE